jgi:hypothetical protein
MAQALSRSDIKSVQENMNRFVKKYLHGLGPIMCDGELGPSTYGRVRTCKYYLGYRRPVNGHIDMTFRKRLRHPKSIRYSSTARVRRGIERRIAQRKHAKRNDAKAHVSSGVARFDGVPCAAWMVPYMEWARSHGWRGRLVSGWRDPVYSESLCFRICGRPRCSGTCAGRSSNHSGSVRPRGALDVSDYARFGQLMRQCPHSPRIFNALGVRDPVHFSASGN